MFRLITIRGWKSIPKEGLGIGNIYIYTYTKIMYIHTYKHTYIHTDIHAVVVVAVVVVAAAAVVVVAIVVVAVVVAAK
jgi:hypothetical protein